MKAGRPTNEVRNQRLQKENRDILIIKRKIILFRLCNKLESTENKLTSWGVVSPQTYPSNTEEQRMTV